MSDLAVMAAPANTNFRYVDEFAVADDAVAVLVVDDDLVDRMLIRRSFRALGIGNPIVEAHDGIAALELLRDRVGCAAPRWPVIVLLDLHMPRMDGFEFLDEIRADRQLSSLLVFVMTSGVEDERRLARRGLNIAGYVAKDAPVQGILSAISAATQARPLGVLPN